MQQGRLEPFCEAARLRHASGRFNPDQRPRSPALARQDRPLTVPKRTPAVTLHLTIGFLVSRDSLTDAGFRELESAPTSAAVLLARYASAIARSRAELADDSLFIC